MLRSRLDRIRAPRAAILENPRDLGLRRRLVEQDQDQDQDDDDVRRWDALAVAELQRIPDLQLSAPGAGEIEVLRTRTALAMARDRLGELSAAVQERVLGPLHRDSLEALGQLSRFRPELQDRLVQRLRELLAAEPGTLWAREHGFSDPAGVTLAEQLIDRVDGANLRTLRDLIMLGYATTGRSDEIEAVVARYPIPGVDEHVEPGEPGYPETDDDI